MQIRQPRLRLHAGAPTETAAVEAVRGRCLLAWGLAAVVTSAACGWSDPVRNEVRHLQRLTCGASGPYDQSAITRTTWQVRASWSCATPAAWDTYVFELQRGLVPYRKGPASSEPDSVVFAKYVPGDYYLLTVATVKQGAPRVDVQFIAGPD